MSEASVDIDPDHLSSSFEIEKTKNLIGRDLSEFTKTGVYDIPARGSTFVTVCDFRTIDVKKEMGLNLQLVHNPMFSVISSAIEMFINGKTHYNVVESIDAICVQELNEYVHLFINSNKLTNTEPYFSIALNLLKLKKKKKTEKIPEPFALLVAALISPFYFNERELYGFWGLLKVFQILLFVYLLIRNK